MKDIKISWNTIYRDDSFLTAKKNMDFDEALINQLKPNERIEREYRWKKPGITYSYKQTCPNEMMHIDHSKRITGGGIVFHSPRDIVFSVVGWLDDPIYKGSLTHKLSVISDRIKANLVKSGIKIGEKLNDTTINYDHCSQYPTPFEIIVDGQKICGLTIRRKQKIFLIQGVLHVATTDPIFDSHINHSDKKQSNLDIDSALR